MFLLATVQCQQGRLSDGIETARKAIKIDPKYAPAYNLIGVAQQQLGRTELALNSFDRAVAADPKFAEAWFNRALNLLTLGRRGHAIESFDRSIALQPGSRARAAWPRHRADAGRSQRGGAQRLHRRGRARSEPAAGARQSRLSASTGSAGSRRPSRIWTARSRLRRRMTMCAITRRWSNCCTGAGARASRITTRG